MKYLWIVRYKVKEFIQTLPRIRWHAPIVRTIEWTCIDIKTGDGRQTHVIEFRLPFYLTPLTVRERAINAWNNPSWRAVIEARKHAKAKEYVHNSTL